MVILFNFTMRRWNCTQFRTELCFLIIIIIFAWMSLVYDIMLPNLDVKLSSLCIVQVDKLKVLSESLLSSTSKAEDRIVDHRWEQT